MDVDRKRWSEIDARPLTDWVDCLERLVSTVKVFKMHWKPNKSDKPFLLLLFNHCFCLRDTDRATNQQQQQ